MRSISCLLLGALLGGLGCATQKETHTPRTGTEQLLISSAIDQSLDRVDLSALKGKTVFLETKYLDCVDKNYVIVSMHNRLLRLGAKLADKPEASAAVVEVVSGGVGTDSEEMFVGVPEIPLPPPSPIAIPKLTVFSRHKLNGTAKLLVVAYDTKTKSPLLDNNTSLARSDHSNWNLLGTGTITTGTVPTEIANTTGELDFNIVNATALAKRSLATQPPADIQPAVHKKAD